MPEITPLSDLRNAGVRDAPSATTSKSWAVLTRLTQIRIMLGLWTAAAALDLAISLAWYGTWATPLRVCATYTCGFCLSLATYRFVYRTNTSPSDFSILRMLAIILPSGFALFVIDVIGRAYAHGESPIRTWPEAYILRTRINWAYFTMMFAFQFTIAWLTTSARTLEMRERQLLEARLSALRLQLNPHFLFNTLNAVMTLVAETGAADAEKMLARLADFLRMTLDEEPAVMVPLAAEIDMVHAYLDIESVRFGDRLRVEYRCDAWLNNLLVPNFILQPLVENAIKHAVAPSHEMVTVTIGATVVDGKLTLRVVDDGAAETASRQSLGNGLGLRNVAARLDALYANAAQLDIDAGQRGFSATVRLPLVE